MALKDELRNAIFEAVREAKVEVEENSVDKAVDKLAERVERGEITTADQLKEEVKALIKTAIEREREAFINHLKQLKQEIVKEVEVNEEKIVDEIWEATNTLAEGIANIAETQQSITGILTHGFKETVKGINLSLENEYQLKRSLDELKSKLDKLHKKYEDVEQEMRDVYWELRRIGG